MLAALGSFAVGLVLRHGPELVEPWRRGSATALDCLGTLLLAVGGWFGGELVYGHGVGMRKNEP